MTSSLILIEDKFLTGSLDIYTCLVFTNFFAIFNCHSNVTSQSCVNDDDFASQSYQVILISVQTSSF